MKILLTGSVHVGKTTLLNRLKTQSPPGVVYIPELARELMESRPDLVSKPGEKGVLPGLGDYHFAEQTRREKEAVSSGALHVLCDRGIVDLIIHSRIFGGKEKGEWIDWVRTYGRIFLLETEGIPFNPQGYPEGVDWEKFRPEYEIGTRRFLDEQGLPYFSLRGLLEDKELIIRRSLEGRVYNPETERRGIER